MANKPHAHRKRIRPTAKPSDRKVRKKKLKINTQKLRTARILRNFDFDLRIDRAKKKGNPRHQTPEYRFHLLKENKTRTFKT